MSNQQNDIWLESQRELKDEIRKSICCNAKIDCRGGGYEGEYIHPVEDYCVECNQTLAVNGSDLGLKIHNPKTGNLIKTK